jgi:hypothetical protein
MSSTPHDSSGTTFTFPGFTGTVTGLTFSQTEVANGAGDVIDISHLGQTTGATLLTRARPLKGSGSNDTGKVVSLEYIGTGILGGGNSGTLVISGGLSINAAATVVSSSVTLAVNDVIRGSAEFRVA